LAKKQASPRATEVIPSMLEGKNNFPTATLNVRQVAIWLGWSEKKVRSHVERQTIPYRKIGGRIVFIRSDLENFLNFLPGISVEEATKNLERRQI